MMIGWNAYDLERISMKVSKEIGWTLLRTSTTVMFCSVFVARTMRMIRTLVVAAAF